MWMQIRMLQPRLFDNVSECLADAISFIDSPAESQAVNGFQFLRLKMMAILNI